MNEYDDKKRIINKKYIIIAIIIVLLITASVLGIYYIFFQKSNTEKDKMVYGGALSMEDNFPLTDSNRYDDDDKDGLNNEQEKELGTAMRNSDTDGDGLKDGEEVNIYNSNPLKYSTSQDEISDYIKVKKGLDINTKYSLNEVKPERVQISPSITLVPNDLNSQYYGGINQGEVDKKLGTHYESFAMFKYEGKIEYLVDEDDLILLYHDYNDNYLYKKYPKYIIKNGKLIITMTKEYNAYNLIITTKEKYNDYLNNK